MHIERETGIYTKQRYWYEYVYICMNTCTCLCVYICDRGEFCLDFIDIISFVITYDPPASDVGIASSDAHHMCDDYEHLNCSVF